jgi:hypothetical protein
MRMGPLKDIIRFGNISLYKGMESKAVMACDINNLESENAQTALYIGASRAKTLLAIALDQSVKSQFQINSTEYGQRFMEWKKSRANRLWMSPS